MKLPAIIFLFLLLPTLAIAGDESTINTLCQNGGNVTLENRVYEIESPVYIPQNTTLEGQPNTKFIVTNFFCTPSIGVINFPNPRNVKINGFEIDGNCNHFDNSLASSAGHSHDQEQLIKIIGDSGNFGSNIEVSNMKLHDSFGDGIQCRFIDGVSIHDNEISNTEHEGIFMSGCKNGLIYNNRDAGITSDCSRLDNCVDCKVYDNLFFSYNGDSNGEYKNGEAGLQVANGGSSMGYDATNNPLSTNNIEVFNNTFSDLMRQSIWLHNYDGNVFVHDNHYVNCSEFTNSGYTFDVGNVSYNNPPSLEQSENVFSSIFDLFNSKPFYSQFTGNQSIILPSDKIQIPSKAAGTIEYFYMGKLSYTLVTLPLEGLSEVQYNVNGSTETHTLMIGENVGDGIKFYNTSIWSGPLHHQLDSLKLDGIVPQESINVTCITPRGSFTPTFNVTEREIKVITLDPLVGIFSIFVIWFFIMMIFIARRTFDVYN